MRTGLSEETVAELADYESSTALPESWKAALRLADHLSGDGAGELPAELAADLRRHFSDPQVLRLGALLAVGSGWQRVIEAFGIRPDHYRIGQAGPWEDGG